jgi:hypothetical protein
MIIGAHERERPLCCPSRRAQHARMRHASAPPSRLARRPHSCATVRNLLQPVSDVTYVLKHHSFHVDGAEGSATRPNENFQKSLFPLKKSCASCARSCWFARHISVAIRHTLPTLCWESQRVTSFVSVKGHPEVQLQRRNFNDQVQLQQRTASPRHERNIARHYHCLGAAAIALRVATTSDGRCSVAALRFSRRCATDDVPGMSTTLGER